jgi:uncharacterized protein YceH (UPF0502 family)
MEKEIPMLTTIEQRVLGSLIEKSRTTPDYYPMSLNAVTAACNQKSSRNPVVNYSEEEVQKALNSLKAISLISTAIGGGSRTIKYKHNITTVYPLHDGQLATICLLLLRGAQTIGEINTNSGRIYEFHTLEAVLETMESLKNLKPPFVKELPRKSGQKETRFIHLLGESLVEEQENVEINRPGKQSDVEERINDLEKQIAELKERLLQLESRIS